MKAKSLVLAVFIIMCMSFESNAQFEHQVAASVLYPTYQSGPFNVFGYSLVNLTDETITVSGYLRDEGNYYPNYYFIVTVDPNNEVSSDFIFQIGPASNAEILITDVED